MMERFGMMLAAVALAAPVWAGGREELIRALNGEARARLEKRRAEVASIATRAEAERRKVWLKGKVAELLGGLIEGRSELKTMERGGFTGDGFRVERVIYESLPGLRVTANVYVPAGGVGPFPAVLISPGHSPAGKAGDYQAAANFARNGMIALTWDPIGQGERLEHYDAALKGSKVGRPTGEHGHTSIQTMLAGRHLGAFFIRDATAGLDYLVSRKDVDAARLGAFGCSGGGTATAYVAAFDERVKAAASACYMTSMEALLESATGAQEAEQSIPGFIAAGLDFGDWIQMAAPRAYAVVSTTEDMFPFAGAEATVEEARRIYGLYGAGERFAFIRGPGTHGALGPVMGEVLGFFVKQLGARGGAGYARVAAAQAGALNCTATGQLTSSLGSKTVWGVSREMAAGTMAAVERRPSKEEVRAALGVRGGRYGARVLGEERFRRIELKGQDGVGVEAWLAVPEGGARGGATLVLSDAPEAALERIAKAGRVGLAVLARPYPAGTEEAKAALLGTQYLLGVRASLVGRSLLSMRVEDALAGLEYLAGIEGVDARALEGEGRGAPGVALLHAAMLDGRLRRVRLERTLVAWRSIVDGPLHKDAAEVAVPGVLKRYDLAGLALALGCEVELAGPVDGMGEAVRGEALKRYLGTALGARRVRVVE